MKNNLLEANTDFEKKRVMENFVRYRKNLIKKKKLATTLSDIRAELLYKDRLGKISKAAMFSEHQDKFGIPEYDIMDFDGETKDLKEAWEIIDNRKPHEMIKGDATDEVSQRWLEFLDKFKNKYFDAKWNWYESVKVKQILMTDWHLSMYIEDQHQEEGNLKEKVEFMYNNLDNHNDRKTVRDLLTAEIHEKSSIQDIGEVLDDFIRDYQSIHKIEGNVRPESLYKEYTTHDLYPELQFLTESRRVMPSIYENRRFIDIIKDEDEQRLYHGIIEKVEEEDTERDHSRSSLSDHEKLEMQIYTTIKRDPYYKHYIYNCLRYESEFMNAQVNDLSMAIAADNYNMRIKFDPIEVPMMEKINQTQGFVEKIINGKAWGAGRRKTARAIAAVQPGSGTITVNGKPINDYFIIPQQRRIVLKPIRVANYTSVLDIELWVRGGGTMGQAKACIPAIAKALSRFDPAIRKMMEDTRFVYSDGRMRERKHYGKKRARKGRVFRRR